MKHLVPAFAAALALAGCSGNTDTAEADPATASMEDTADAGMDGGTAAAPAATETVVVDRATTVEADDGTTTITAGPDGAAVEVDGRDVDAEIGPGGVRATVTPDR